MTPAMLAGHYSAALLAKSLEPRLPLWLLAIAAQLVDVLWACFVLLGIEHMRIDPSLASNPLDLYDMPYTHSLVGALAWSGLAALAVFFAWGRSAFAALVAGGVVASHWLLDFLVHRRDLPIWDRSVKYGLGLWDHPVIAFLLEAGLLAVTCWLLLRSGTLPAAAKRDVVLLVVGLLAMQLFFTLGPPPFSPPAVAVLALVLFATVPLIALRIERRAAGA
jgi:hypothetical protein